MQPLLNDPAESIKLLPDFGLALSRRAADNHEHLSGVVEIRYQSGKPLTNILCAHTRILDEKLTGDKQPSDSQLLNSCCLKALHLLGKLEKMKLDLGHQKRKPHWFSFFNVIELLNNSCNLS